jgi:hypothetical protein
VVERLRAVMRECAPEAAEIVSYNMICWKQKRLIAYLTASSKDVTLGFIHGTALHDPNRLLRGRGKGTRHIKVVHPDDVPSAAICDFTSQSLEIDRK